MSWDHKKRGRSQGYFYLSVRTPGYRHPRKLYVGRGEASNTMAGVILQRRAERLVRKKRLDDEKQSTAGADDLLQQLHEQSDAMLRAWLMATGHHYHRGEWRCKNGKAA